MSKITSRSSKGASKAPITKKTLVPNNIRKPRQSLRKQDLLCECCQNLEKQDEAWMDDDARYNPSGKVVIKHNGKVIGLQG